MIDTQIFSGSNSHSFSSQSLHADGNDDTLFLSYTDIAGRSSRASIKAIDTAAYKASNEFKILNTPDQPVLIYNFWHIRKLNTTTLVYSDECDLGFIFTSNSSLTFEKLTNIYSEFQNEVYLPLSLLGYFNESRFAKLLKTQGYTFERLLKTPGMTVQKIDLMLAHSLSLSRLFIHGITLDRIAAVNVLQLEKILDNSESLEMALRFLTLNQILGHDHLPREIPLNFSLPKEETQYPYSNGSSIEFEVFLKNDVYTVLYRGREGELMAQYSLVPVGNFSTLRSADLEMAPALELVHDWYRLDDYTPDGSFRAYYSQSSPYLIECKAHRDFPLDRGEAILTPYCIFQFFKEVRLIKILDKNGLKDFTPSKLELLMNNKSKVEYLIKDGLSSTDLAAIDENALGYVFANFDCYRPALTFVDVRELFALKMTAPVSYLYSMYISATERAQTVAQTGRRFVMSYF